MFRFLPKPMDTTLTRDVGFASRDEAVDAIHTAKTTDFLRGPAKAIAPFFEKRNTADGAVVEHRLGLAKITLSADGHGRVSERTETVAPPVHLGHYALTDVFKGTREAADRAGTPRRSAVDIQAAQSRARKK